MGYLFQGVELKSSREFSLEGIHTIWVQTTSQDIHFTRDKRTGLLVREYLHEKTEIAFVEKRGDALCFSLEQKPRHVLASLVGDDTEQICFFVPDDFHGQIYAGTASGDVEFLNEWELANMQVNTVSGDISIYRARAQHFLIESKSGDIDMEGTWGERQIASISGDICVESGSGSLCVNCISGDIDVRNDVGRMEIGSTSGDVCVEAGMLEGESQISSVSGDVEMKIAADNVCLITASTVSGDIGLHMGMVQITGQNKRSVKFAYGAAGDTDKTLEVSTVSGDISLWDEVR